MKFLNYFLKPKFPLELSHKGLTSKNLAGDLVDYHKDNIPFIRTIKIDGYQVNFCVRTAFFNKAFIATKNKVVDADNNVKCVLSRAKMFKAIRMIINRWEVDNSDTVKFFALQTEIAGPNIQNNPLQLEKPEAFVFNIVLVAEKAGRLVIDPWKYLGIFEHCDIHTVPYIIRNDNGSITRSNHIDHDNEVFNEYKHLRPYIKLYPLNEPVLKTIAEMRELVSEYSYDWGNRRPVEALVFRNFEKDVAFKVSNPKYKI